MSDDLLLYALGVLMGVISIAMVVAAFLVGGLVP